VQLVRAERLHQLVPNPHHPGVSDRVDVARGLQAGTLTMSCEDPENPANWPRNMFVWRSNLLGSDKRVTNYGGGNTSSKIMDKDPLTGQPVEVLWVKGSGGDSASIRLDGFATLYMDRLRALKGLYRGPAHEDEIPLRAFAERYLPDGAGPTIALETCLFEPSPDEHFLIGRHPDAENAIVGAGFSGHGFKFCSVVGEILADLVVDGKTSHDIDLFRLDRFGPVVVDGT